MTATRNGHAWLTPAEAAELLRVHKRTIYDACAADQLPHVRVGRTIRIPRSALEVGRATAPAASGSGAVLDLLTRNDEVGRHDPTAAM
jgi:excisionase family DNA binding protein